MEAVEQYILETLQGNAETKFWQPTTKGTFMPFCQRQLLLSKLYGGKEQTVPFEKAYSSSIHSAIQTVVEQTWIKQGLLWGDFRCSNVENCGVIIRNQAIKECPRCQAPVNYLRKELEESQTGIKVRCDGALYCEPLGGYLVYKLNTRNEKVIKAHVCKEPYPSENYQTAFAATLLQSKITVVGRMVLWLSKSKPTPFRCWVYPDLGTALVEEQVNLVKDLNAKIEAGLPLDTVKRCKDIKDEGSCQYGHLCFSGMRGDDEVANKFKEKL